MTIPTYNDLNRQLSFLNERYEEYQRLEQLFGRKVLAPFKQRVIENKKHISEEFDILTDFIETIDNELLKEIVFYRVCDNYTFEYIGELLGYTRSGAYKIFKKANIEHKYKEYKSLHTPSPPIKPLYLRS